MHAKPRRGRHRRPSRVYTVLAGHVLGLALLGSGL